MKTLKTRGKTALIQKTSEAARCGQPKDGLGTTAGADYFRSFSGFLLDDPQSLGYFVVYAENPCATTAGMYTLPGV